jgi:hypothetical protein
LLDALAIHTPGESLYSFPPLKERLQIEIMAHGITPFYDTDRAQHSNQRTALGPKRGGTVRHQEEEIGLFRTRYNDA